MAKTLTFRVIGTVEDYSGDRLYINTFTVKSFEELVTAIKEDITKVDPDAVMIEYRAELVG